LFEYFRNDVLDANDWFSDHNLLPKPKERQNDFGGVLGGALVKDRTFFFFSYEGLRLRQPVTQETVVPDASSRQVAPAAIQPFADAFPVQNGPELGNGLAQFNASYSNPSTLTACSLRLDHTMNSKWSLFGRYNYAPSETIQRGPSANNPPVLSNTESTSFSVQTVTMGATMTASHQVGNEIRANYSNVRAASEFSQDSFGGAVPPLVAALLPPGISSGEFFFYIIGVGNVSLGKNQVNEQRQINFIDNLSLTRGTHQLKFGIDYRWLSPFSSPEYYSQEPIFSGVNGPGGIVSGIPPNTYVFGTANSSLVSKNFSLYGQDTWRVSPRTTLTYGLRWEVNPALKGKNAASEPYTVEGLDNPATMTLAPNGTPLYNTSYSNLAPRLGMAYRASQHERWETVIRAGAGVFYDLGSGSLGFVTSGYPFLATNTFTNAAFPLMPEQAAAPLVSTPAGAGISIADPNLKLPRTYQWNVAIEQSLGANQSVSATYVGALGRDLLRQDTFDNFVFPNSEFGIVSVTRNTATSDYNGIQLKFQRRLSRGLQAIGSYTFSHSIDIASNDSGSLNTPSNVASPNIDRGSSDFDVRHSLSGAITYDLPAPGTGRLLRAALLGGWSLDSFVMARSALPVTVFGGYSVVDGRLFESRPDTIPGLPYYLYGSAYPGGKVINNTPDPNLPECAGAFCPAASGQQGDLGRNALRGFGAWQADLAVRREFPIGERAHLQFRAEFFNIFNHPNFGNPANTLLGQPLFGQSTTSLASSLGAGGAAGGFNPLYQVGGPRSIQLALKLAF
jgi:hypothetical protein